MFFKRVTDDHVIKQGLSLSLLFKILLRFFQSFIFTGTTAQASIDEYKDGQSCSVKDEVLPGEEWVSILQRLQLISCAHQLETHWALYHCLLKFLQRIRHWIEENHEQDYLRDGKLPNQSVTEAELSSFVCYGDVVLIVLLYQSEPAWYIVNECPAAYWENELLDVAGEPDVGEQVVMKHMQPSQNDGDDGPKLITWEPSSLSPFVLILHFQKLCVDRPKRKGVDY